MGFNSAFKGLNKVERLKQICLGRFSYGAILEHCLSRSRNSFYVYVHIKVKASFALQQVMKA